MATLNDLTAKKCKPCEGGVKPFSPEMSRDYVRRLPGWQLSADGKLISREYAMKNFRTAVNCINAIAEVAETEDHHPDLHLTGYRKLNVELTTHAIGGLSENDFILAAKIEALPKVLKT